MSISKQDTYCDCAHDHSGDCGEENALFDTRSPQCAYCRVQNSAGVLEREGKSQYDCSGETKGYQEKVTNVSVISSGLGKEILDHR